LDPATSATIERQHKRTAFLVVACLGTLAFFAISFAPHITVAKYRISCWFLAAIVWIVFALRRKLALRPLHYALFAIALVLHDLGAFGWYSRTIGGLQYDWCVHFYFGAVGAAIVATTMRERIGLHGPALYVLTLLAIAGMSALHEIVEWATTVFLGDYGMLYVGPDNPYDSQEDMFAGVLGATFGVVVLIVHATFRRR
jgi:uncharacterized membrane protein YjdF